MNYTLDDNFNFVPMGAGTKTKALLNRTQKHKGTLAADIKNFEQTGQVGGFLLDFLATGVNMIKNGIEGKRWSDNTVFKGLGKAKTKRKASPAQKKRGELIKKVMKKYGVSLPEASKMIKQAGL
ncbi:MV08 [Cafeteriavirus-dependent mavirus]|nr:MV08 [Cafeteriavirus-dependent mavirus]CAI9421327.1 MV08 [Cafeteriavirus-dependent mavirus]CAI9421356.1 MV08 [Cafeteriavirus-dependent mavirus]CAI9421376.1 MV08 [Cafeteriavirus-dependent mavirus]CAJ0990535.1 MV08 [Cafeteriavirus-dependent mavirus]